MDHARHRSVLFGKLDSFQAAWCRHLSSLDPALSIASCGKDQTASKQAAAMLWSHDKLWPLGPRLLYHPGPSSHPNPFQGLGYTHHSPNVSLQPCNVQLRGAGARWGTGTQVNRLSSGSGGTAAAGCSRSSAGVGGKPSNNQSQAGQGVQAGGAAFTLWPCLPAAVGR